jgi:hypothetical protein
MHDRADRTALRDGLVSVAAFAATLPLTRLALEGFAPIPRHRPTFLRQGEKSIATCRGDA